MNLNQQHRAPRDRQSGQALVLIPLLLVVLLGMCALVLDLGNVYVCYQQLQSSTNAAALAAGAAIPQGTAINTANLYSGKITTDFNFHPNLTISTVTPTLGCAVTSSYPGLELPICQAYGTQPSANVIRVTESATVPTYFAKIFGIRTVPISASAVASATT